MSIRGLAQMAGRGAHAAPIVAAAAGALLAGAVVAASLTQQSSDAIGLPKPGGLFPIGTLSFALVDAARPEGLTESADDRRELLVRAWYPAAPAPQSKPEPFWGQETPEIGRRLGEYLRMPSAFEGLAAATSHAFADAPLRKSERRFPVLIFSHGYIPGFVAQNTAQMEELASHGYIVFSIGHTFESVANVFPDGRIVPYSTARRDAFAQGAAAAQKLNLEYAAATDPNVKEALLQKVGAAWPTLRESLEIWKADTRFVLDELERMESGKRSAFATAPVGPRRSSTRGGGRTMFTGRLDLNRIGVFGMSFGGAVAGEVCAVDTRCKAGLNIDGMQYGDLRRPLERPFMFLQSESAGAVNRFFFDAARNDAYYIVVKGTRHFNYSDISIFPTEFQKAGLLGPIDGARVEAIMNAYVVAFFDKYLRGKATPLLDGSSGEYPEVEFLRRGSRPAPGRAK